MHLLRRDSLLLIFCLSLPVMQEVQFSPLFSRPPGLALYSVPSVTNLYYFFVHKNCFAHLVIFIHLSIVVFNVTNLITEKYLGKNFLNVKQLIKVTVCYTQSISCVSLFETTWDCSPPGSSVHVDSPGKNAGVGCHALLQGPRDRTQVSRIVGRFFTI